MEIFLITGVKEKNNKKYSESVKYIMFFVFIFVRHNLHLSDALSGDTIKKLDRFFITLSDNVL
jgi:hypothetical protein